MNTKHWLVVGLIGWNVIVCLVYGYDKWRAARGASRVSERRLLTLALALGAVGAWLGVLVFRHKIRKPRFLTVLFAVSLLWGVAGWLAWR